MVMAGRACAFRALLGLFLITLATPSLAASLVAQLDRAQSALGQSVILTVTATDLEGELDFSALQQDFEILDTGSSRSVRMTNDVTQATQTWQLSLMPMRTGTLTVPSFSLAGVVSQPLSLDVQEAAADAGQGLDFELLLALDKTQAFVQEQVILSAKVYQSRSILEGSLSDPEASGVVMQRLGNDKSYTEQRGDRQYQVIERKYALFPQESGEVTIGPLRLLATIRDDSRSGRSLFTPTRKIRVNSNTVTLTVDPRAASSSSSWWLPAQALSLTHDWSADPMQARVDEPITLTLQLSAKGLQGSQLPPIVPPELSQARIYPDQAEVRDQMLEDAVVSYRVEKWAIIPREAGDITLPPIRLEWFDTERQELRYATLPAQTLRVSGPANPAPAPPPDQTVPAPIAADLAPAAVTPPIATADSPAAPVENATSPWWRWLALVAMAGWMLTGLLWALRARRARQPLRSPSSAPTPRASVSLNGVKAACATGDAASVSEALLAWGKGRWPDNPPRNLSGIAQRISSPTLSERVAAIEAALYSAEGGQVDCRDVVDALAAYATRTSTSSRGAGTAGALPQL